MSEEEERLVERPRESDAAFMLGWVLVVVLLSVLTFASLLSLIFWGP